MQFSGLVVILIVLLLKFPDHIEPVASTILTLARSNFFVSFLLVESHIALPTDQRNPLRDTRSLDAIMIALQEHSPKPLTSESRMHAQRMNAKCLAIFIVARVWR
jgi:hypothetical protein